MRVLVSSFFVALLLVVPTFAAALRAAPEPSEAQRQRARELFQEAVTHGDAGDWEQARQKYEQAYALVREPSILLNLAHAQVESGHLVEGAESYRLFLDEVQSGDRLARHRRDARSALNAVEARLPRLRVNARTLQDGDVITLDGEPFERTRLGTELRVGPGEHLLVVTRGRDTYAYETFTLRERERHTLDLALTEPVATPAQIARRTDEGGRAPREQSDRRRRLGLGIGLGTGVPMLAAIIAAIVVSR